MRGIADLHVAKARSRRERPVPTSAVDSNRPIPARRPAPKLPDGGPGFFAVRVYEAVVRDLRRSAIT